MDKDTLFQVLDALGELHDNLEAMLAEICDYLYMDDPAFNTVFIQLPVIRNRCKVVAEGLVKI